MKKLKAIISIIAEGLSQMVFPNVCLCCGKEVLGKDQHICPFCLYKRFEDANPDHKQSSSGVLLPRDVFVQQALWSFDKGGVLQNLMHHLKYERLVGIGTQLGGVVARRAMAHPTIKTLLEQQPPILVPVPLHYLKFKKRGFNQAFYIARGIENALEIPICPIDAVIRTKYTLSQTGFSLQKRIANMDKAFRVPSSDLLKGKTVIIVDDVFTTGATTFELAKTIREAGADSIMIWTIAQA